MTKLFRYIIVCALFTLSGCIQNDIPLPYIKGEVLKFEVEGQKEAKIDASKNIIYLDMSDTVDLRSSNVKLFEITPEASTTLNFAEKVDLTKDTLFSITTYQEYNWKIVVTQKIDRHIKIEGQIGDAVIDVENRNAVVKVSADADLYNIVVEEMQLGPSIAVTSPEPQTISNFSLPRTFEVSCFGETQQWTVVVMLSQELISTGEVDAWGTFAYLNGAVQPNNPMEAGFEYKKENATTWQYIKGLVAGSRVSAKITGLLPNTSYIVRAKLGATLASEKNFKTETTPVIENMSFDNWNKDGTKWYPNTSGGNSFWATGNEGVTLAGKTSNTTPVEGADAVKGKAVRMETIGGVLIAKIAAGNIFTGIYKQGMPPKFEEMKKLVVFGRPYTGRPTKLRGWYKYFPKVVNLAADPAFPFPDYMGKMDWCNIYVKLENWGDATERPAANLVTLVGSGDFRSDKEAAQYTKFEIDIKYEDTKLKPTHILLIATPSINGGDFCGGVGSVLFVDEFEFGFE